jgi:hypothetical protein
VYNLAEFQGAEDGNLEFTVSNFLEDLDTDANSAIDVVGGWFYFQCSDVDPTTGFATTTLCGHQIPTDLSIFSYVQVMIEPMTCTSISVFVNAYHVLAFLTCLVIVCLQMAIALLSLFRSSKRWHFSSVSACFLL